MDFSVSHQASDHHPVKVQIEHEFSNPLWVWMLDELIMRGFKIQFGTLKCLVSSNFVICIYVLFPYP
jgi:hypothetical protein